jgi:2,3-dihydroxybiphenyl 1,2-dioxygenase
MELKSLGYVGIGTRALDEWKDFATRLLGMQVVDKSRSALALRMDNRAQRLLVDQEIAEGTQLFGWEVENGAALQALAARVERAGVAVHHESTALADQRCVRELVSFHDPVGNRIEVFHGPGLAAAPFQPGRTISGFRTGALGLGHAVLTVERIETVLPFYQEVLGFRLSDYMLRPFKAYFLHINARHHSLALIETGKNGMHHLMVELFSFDDVGQGYDIAQQEEERVNVTLGRHSNDYVTSFYAKSPSSFMVEYGWGGREIDPERWSASEIMQGASFWGHERSWLPLEDRLVARRLRLQAADLGYRAPVQVLDGNHQLAPARRD